MRDWIKRATTPSGSRWGISSFPVTTALFWLALSPALYAIYLSFAGGDLVPPVNWLPSVALVGSIVAVVFGIVISLFAIGLSIWWLGHPTSGDSVTQILTEIQKDLSQIKEKLGIKGG